MKKINSFAAALVLLAMFTVIVHFICANNDLRDKSGQFGTWYNTYKDLSFNALSQNLDKDSVLMLGSSEFRHGRKTQYHPTNFFKDTDVKLVTVGGPFNQTLFHTVALGSLQPHLKSKKVILLVSPTWFKQSGVKKNDYALRFSETEYFAFMENKNVPLKTKKYVAKRTKNLLSKNKSLQMKVRMINNVNLNKESNLLYGFERRHAFDKDKITVGAAMRFMMKNKKTPPNFERYSPDNFNWNNLIKEAHRDSEDKADNPFYMSNRVWRNKFRQVYPKMKDVRLDENYEKSPEYSDLEAFLQIAKANDIEVKLILLPVNGRWYDYTGMTADKRAVVGQKIKNIAGRYGADYTDMTGYSYNKYIVSDAVHPWNEGWVRINEKVAEFVHK